MRTLLILVVGLIVLSFSRLSAQSDSITEISFTYDDAGNRTAREIVYYQGGRKSTSIVKVEEQEIEIGKELKVYPNPASSSLFVALNDEALKEDRRIIYLYDNTGKLHVEQHALQDINQVNVSTLPNGSYILKLIYGTYHKEWIIIKN